MWQRNLHSLSKSELRNLHVSEVFITIDDAKIISIAGKSLELDECKRMNGKERKWNWTRKYWGLPLLFGDWLKGPRACRRRRPWQTGDHGHRWQLQSFEPENRIFRNMSFIWATRQQRDANKGKAFWDSSQFSPFGNESANRMTDASTSGVRGCRSRETQGKQLCYPSKGRSSACGNNGNITDVKTGEGMKKTKCEVSWTTNDGETETVS